MTTAATIIARARYRSDKLNSTFISDTADCLPWADHGHRELYDLLIAAYGQEYFLTTADMYVSASTLYSTLSTYYVGTGYTYTYQANPLTPTTITASNVLDTATSKFYKLIRLDLSTVAGSITTTTIPDIPVYVNTHYFVSAGPNPCRVPLRPFEFSDQVLSDTAAQWDSSGANVRYRLSGDRIYWHPRPSAHQFVRMYYIPLATTLTATTSVVDTWAEPWTEYVELYISRAISAKEHDISQVAAVQAQLDEVKRRIIETAPPRDAGQPQSIVDVRSNDTWHRCLWPDEIP